MSGTTTSISYGVPFTLPFLGGGVHLSSIANGLFLLSILVTFVLALILFYHWIRYGVEVVGMVVVMVLYASGVSILLLAALGFLTQI